MLKKSVLFLSAVSLLLFSTLSAEGVKSYTPKGNMVEIDSMKYPVFPGIKTVDGDESWGGITYTITEKNKKAAEAKAAKIVKFYKGKQVGEYVIASFHKVTKEGVNAWYGNQCATETGSQVFILIKENVIKVWANSGCNEDLVLEELAK